MILDVIKREGIYLWYYFSLQLEQIFRYWVFGIVIGSIISVFGKTHLHRLFAAISGKRIGVFGLVIASMLGIASPLCMYGTIPISTSFSQKGMRDDWLGAFMMSSILLNPQLIIYSAALGPTALVIRVLLSLFCGITAGLCIRIFYKGKSFFRFDGFFEPKSRDTDPNLSLRLLKNIWRNIKATGPYFFLGIVLSALFQRYVPENWIVRLFGNQREYGVLMAATIGVPLYVCGGGTIPLLQGWLANGMSMGAAAAFMVTGPATKITNLGAVKIVLGAKCFTLYLLFTMVFAFFSGILINLII